MNKLNSFVSLQGFGLIYPTTDLMMQAEYTYLRGPSFITTTDRLISKLSENFTKGKRPLVPREQERILLDVLRRLKTEKRLQWLLITEDQELGIVSSLKKTLQTYLDQGLDYDDLKRVANTSNSPRLKDISLLYEEYQRSKDKNALYDPSDVFQWLFRFPITEPLPEPLHNIVGIRAFQSYFSNPLEQRFFLWLCSRIPDCVIEKNPPPTWKELQLPEQTELLRGFDLRREIQEVLLRVKRSLIKGAPAYSWAILAPTEATYFPVLREELEKARIPYSMVLRIPLIQQPLIQAIQILLKTAITPHRFSLVHLLQTPMLNTDTILASELATLWPAEGLEGNWTTWFSRLEREKIYHLFQNNESLGDDDGRPQKKLNEDFFTRSEEYLHHWQATLSFLPSKATPQQYRKALLEVLTSRNVLQNLRNLREIDRESEELLLLEKQHQTAWQSFLQAMEQLEVASSVVHEEDQWQFSDYVQELTALLNSIELPIPYGQPSGVHIGTPLRMRGQRFHGVAMLGLNDGVFPAYGGKDWMLDEESSQALSQAGFSIPSTEDRAKRQEELFRGCLQMAEKHWILSFSRRDFTGQALNSSPFLLLLQMAFPGRLVLQETESSSYRIKPEETLSEESLLQVALSRTATRQPAIPELRIPSHALPRKIIQSPSAYNQYQTCPYSYFLSYILRLEQPKSVESDLNPLDRGTLMHRILEALIKAWKIPLYETVPPDLNACREVIPHIMDQFWLQPELLDLSPRLWQAERQRYLLRFEQWLEEEAQLFAFRGGVPQYTEWKFGTEAALQLDAACYPIQGKIDRIDISSEPNKQVYLYDYKTGSSSFYKDLKKQPLNDLQLPCYGLVWEKQNREPLNSAAYYFPGRGEGTVELVETVRPEQWHELRQDALRLLRNIDTLIGRGWFPMAPKDNACERCFYADLCRKEGKS